MNSDKISDQAGVDTAAPQKVARAQHPISREHISPHALQVLYRLKDAGFQAFLVGGAVRDLLIGRRPKDFDIATNAHPEQVRKLFRNCRLIGRRFHLAHIRFGYEIIEVATFRASHTVMDEDRSTNATGSRVLDDHGRILRDNLYGSIEEDVWRRDFTANALYYHIDDFSVWDYVGGVADATARVLRLIGDPETRYREDPVRMLRAVRFAAKLDFTLDAATAKPLPHLAPMLANVPAARLFDEVTKLFLAGSAMRSFELLHKFSLFEHVFPETAAVLAQDTQPQAAQLLQLGLLGTDRRVAENKSVTPAFLFAVLLWPAVRQRIARDNPAGLTDSPTLCDTWEMVYARQQRRVAMPRRFGAVVREILGLQPRFTQRSGKRSVFFLQHPRFRAAYDFMLLRVAVGELEQEMADWWTNIQKLTPEQQMNELLSAKKTTPVQSIEAQTETQEPVAQQQARKTSPNKKASARSAARRRRRKRSSTD